MVVKTIVACGLMSLNTLALTFCICLGFSLMKVKYKQSLESDTLLQHKMAIVIVLSPIAANWLVFSYLILRSLN